MLMGGLEVGRGEGGEGDWRDECSVNGGDGQRLLSKPFLKLQTKELKRVKPAAYSSISQPSPKRPTFSFGGGSCLGVLCRGALLGRVVWEEEKSSEKVRIHIK